MNPQFDTVVRFILAVLFAGLWQAALFAALAWLVLRVMPNANATTRHTVLAAALLASLIVPVATAAVATIAIAQPQAATPSVTNPARLRQRNPAPQPQISRAAVSQSESSGPVVVRPHITLPRVAAFAVVIVWLAGAAFVLLRLILSLVHLERLKKDSLPVPIEYRTQLARWSAATKGSREVRLCRSDEIVIPIAVGLFDAMILIPQRFLEELAPADVDRIALHELAHLRRADDWLNAIERIATALLFFNPGIAWIAAQLDLEREVACDDWVLQQNDPLPYATCLAKVVETTIWPYRAMSAPGAFLTRRAMSVRIERLLTAHRDVRVRTSLGPAGLIVAAVAALGIVAAYVSPSFAYTVSAPTNVPVVKRTQEVAPRERVVVKYLNAPQPAALTSATLAPSPAPHVTAVTYTYAAHHTVTGPGTRSIGETVSNAVSQSVSNAIARSTSMAQAISASAHPLHSVEVAANSPDYIDELNNAGYKGLSVDELIELRSIGVTGDYIKGIEAAGLSHPTVRQLTELKALNVQPDDIRGMRQYFGSGFDIDTAASLKATGVTPEYLNDLASAGYRNLNAHQILELQSLHVDGAFIRSAEAHGFHNLSVDELVRLKTSGIL